MLNRARTKGHLNREKKNNWKLKENHRIQKIKLSEDFC